MVYWRGFLGSDPLPIIVECSNRLVYSLNEVLNTNHSISKRPKLSLKNFDKELFPILIQKRINTLSFCHSSIDPLQAWYEYIFDCSLKAEAILYDGLEYNKGKVITVSLKKLNNERKKVKSNSPWWDKECDILVNKRK